MLPLACVLTCIILRGSFKLHLGGVNTIITQDAHKRTWLVMQVAEWLTASLYQCSRELSDMS